MIVTTAKKLEEIIVHIDGKKVFLIGCDICAKLCRTGGDEQIAQYAEIMRELGFTVVGERQIEGVCNELLVRKFMRDNQTVLSSADTFLIASCGNGVQVFKDFVPEKTVLPLLNTLFLGSMKTHRQFQERCYMCGDCVVGITEGICPKTQCAKFINNGPCGGSINGRCEVDPDRECAWYRIYERMRERGREHLLDGIFLPTNHSQDLIPRKMECDGKVPDATGKKTK
ncbi:MAG: methylenetetrahydrofolate reductase C-terminal domain-containing protein [Candidatus Wallbacteria bacterium]|nr:methylenetetrahydrofolate reductase C-terminal domain-containing protein [Candidatus Wallbacteria bacterium]